MEEKWISRKFYFKCFPTKCIRSQPSQLPALRTQSASHSENYKIECSAQCTQHFVIERSMSMHKKLHSYDIHMRTEQHTRQVEPRAFYWTGLYDAGFLNGWKVVRKSWKNVFPSHSESWVSLYRIRDNIYSSSMADFSKWFAWNLLTETHRSVRAIYFLWKIAHLPLIRSKMCKF